MKINDKVRVKYVPASPVYVVYDLYYPDFTSTKTYKVQIMLIDLDGGVKEVRSEDVENLILIE